jgi:glycosyltransferase involved in cell wall biosynthesis
MKRSAADPNSKIAEGERPAEFLDVHVVILNNYIRPHHVASYRELAKRVRKLTILLSVSMEPDRAWEAQWTDLDVRIQKNWMYTAKWKHSVGFQESNFIHFPIDTTSQLKKLSPDIVFSYEMGVRTLLACWFRKRFNNHSLVMVGNMSEHIESERGFLRRRLRSIIRRGVDAFTYNGPSCFRYLKSLAIDDDQLFHLPYCIDSDTVYQGDRVSNADASTIKLIYCGAMSPRKGILQFTTSLAKWCSDNPGNNVEFLLAGSGELSGQLSDLAASNLSINMLGNLGPSQLAQQYGVADICVFPSLADEWGLVPIEAMASGLPVLGSKFAQSVEACVEDGVTGWSFDPTSESSLAASIENALSCEPAKRFDMGQTAKQAVASISSETTADSFCQVIKKLVSKR